MIKQKELFYISLTIFLTIVAWIVIELYKIRTEGVIEKEVELPTIENYKLDMEVLDRLENKKSYEE